MVTVTAEIPILGKENWLFSFSFLEQHVIDH